MPPTTLFRIANNQIAENLSCVFSIAAFPDRRSANEFKSERNPLVTMNALFDQPWRYAVLIARLQDIGGVFNSADPV